MNDVSAIRNGGLANNSRFLGDAVSETIAIDHQNGSWNGDDNYTAVSTAPWFRWGSQSGGNSVVAGLWAKIGANGDTANHLSHRTILLGY
ncbi:hypothetical protein FWG76_00160 [Candidatus Saccharibacteria bacterium]|nr:hypothetical protein [Candidatus Saccharibacteria bacterium]